MTTTGEVLKPTREELIAFLNGSGSIDDLWFGEQDKFHRGYWWRKYLDVLSAPQGNAAQEGYVLVPVDLTEEMKQAAHNAFDGGYVNGKLPDMYRALIAAAPSNKEVER